MILTGQLVFAEGSKELSANGGSRAYLVSATTVTPSFIFPTVGTMKVYVKAGETINVGSSVQGVGFGTINLRAPNGNTYSSGTSTSVGLIANRAQEVAGPQPNAGGYTPYTKTVQAAEEGVWEIDFIAQNNGVAGGENPVPVPAASNWAQPTGQYITAFDVSVRNASNTAFLTGRVYTNIFSGILGTFDVGFNGIFKILTKDGYQYSLDNNGQAGNGFSFFVNNKGFRKADGTPLYQSVNSLNTTNIQDPRAADTPTDITYKIFFNTPATDLPASAPTPGGATTWLLSPVIEPTLGGGSFTGTEGTAGRAGTAPLGATFGFDANRNGTYAIAIDVNKNGVYTDAIDRKLNGTAISGNNKILWDGLDGLGNKVPAGNYNTTINVLLFGGEVHFPFFDVERNVNGIKLTRMNGYLAPDFTVYWDDTPISITGTPSNPIKNITTGLNSQINGHKWGSPGAGATEFGDEKGLDTWTYIASTPLVSTLNFQLLEADLQVTGITANTSGGCVGQQVTYTVPVKNNGPSAVTGSKFNFTFPANLTNVTVTSTQTTGGSTVSNVAVTATAYNANIDLDNGATCTFTITGKVATTTPGSIIVSASILRPADVTDPDATNPDIAPPTDAQAECDAPPSGTGCNNIKTNSLTFLALPDAGPDQTIVQDEIVTLTSTIPGIWSQLSNIPVTVIIASPVALTTKVSGFKDVGMYQFIRANAAGCTDTVLINVVPKKLDIPNIFTPNGDGKNDTFIIPGIGSFPGSQLIVFNRWGNEVYRSANYQNTWNGGDLTEGTYYYVFNKKEPSGSFTTFKGWIFLKR